MGSRKVVRKVAAEDEGVVECDDAMAVAVFVVQPRVRACS